MYKLNDYAAMIADTIRMDAYAAALKAAVRPGSVVLDIGTGTGICALLACRYGAGRVYALETNPAVLLGPEIAAANGFADRIEFVRCFSTRWEAPEPIDILVSDLRGVLPLAGQHIPSIIDARDRLLRPGGIQIPQRDLLWASVVNTPREHRRVASIWTHNKFEFDLSPARAMTVNRWSKVALHGLNPLTEPVLGGILDYRSLEQPDVTLHFDWEAPQPGEAHGFTMWFDAEILEGIGFSNRPWQPQAIYGSAFFPWPVPVTLDGTERIEVKVDARLVGDEYVWRWKTRIHKPKPAAAESIAFDQSTLGCHPLDLARLRLRAPANSPGLGVEGRQELKILQGLAEGNSIQAISESLADAWPARYSDWKSALEVVAEVAERVATRESEHSPITRDGGLSETASQRRSSSTEA